MANHPNRSRGNALTAMTNREQGAQHRSDKIGQPERGAKRADAWARWMLETRHGITVPADAELRQLDGADRVQFMHVILHRPYTETIRGPRGGFKGYNYVREREELVPVGEGFTLPAHCRSVRFADRWHEAHQLGHSAEFCGVYGWQQNATLDLHIHYGAVAA